MGFSPFPFEWKILNDISHILIQLIYFNSNTLIEIRFFSIELN